MMEFAVLRLYRIALAQECHDWSKPLYPFQTPAGENIGRVVMTKTVVDGFTMRPGFYPKDGLSHLFKAKEKRQNRLQF